MKLLLHISVEITNYLDLTIWPTFRIHEHRNHHDWLSFVRDSPKLYKLYWASDCS